MPTDNTTVTNEPIEQLTPAEMFLQDMNAAEAESTPPEGSAEPEVLAAEEASGMPAAEQAPVAEAAPEQDIPASTPPVDSEKQEMRNTISALLDIVKQNQAERAAQSQENVAAAEAQEEMAEEEPFDEEKFNEEFYANPAGYIRNLAEQIADKNVTERLSGLQDELAPLLEESKAAQHRESVKKVLGEFLDATPDANDYFEDIARYINDNNLSAEDPRSYKDAYMESKMNSQNNLIEQLRQANAEGSKTLDDYLSDNDSVQRIIMDDNIKSKVIENYLKELQEGGRPATISNSGTQIPGTPAKTAASMEDARNLFLGDLRR